MKKYFVYLMMALAAVTFNACSDDDPLQKEPETEQPGNQDDNEGTENPDEPNTPDEPSGDSNNILVAYFSWGGTTQRMAQQIVAHTGADLFRIEPVTPYPEDYTECTEVALEERDSDARPAISSTIDEEAWAEYDTIFIGCPVWWHTTPMTICTFAESYDFAGKTVVPFCTYASTYRDETLARIAELTSGAEVHLDGLGLTSGSLNNESNVENWLREIGIIE